MDKDKSEVFKSFTNKAIKRFQEKKVRKYRTLHIPSLDENIKIRNLDYPEIVECTEIEDENDPNAADKYTIYLAVVEPELKRSRTGDDESGADPDISGSGKYL